LGSGSKPGNRYIIQVWLNTDMLKPTVAGAQGSATTHAHHRPIVVVDLSSGIRNKDYTRNGEKHMRSGSQENLLSPKGPFEVGFEDCRTFVGRRTAIVFGIFRCLGTGWNGRYEEDK